jgi:hypothetical protein
MTKSLTLIATAATAITLAACSSPAASDSATTPTATALEATAESSTTGDSSSGGTPIAITAGDQTFKATLNDSRVAQDFAAMLPVTLPWFRNGGIEFITELDAPLTESGPFYTDVQPGDLVYYNPRDSITIIYEETSSVPTLTKMGQITSGLDSFDQLPDNVDLHVELG